MKINTSPIIKPGINPALNKLLTLTSAITAYKTMGTEGGITTPIVPAAAINEADEASL